MKLSHSIAVCLASLGAAWHRLLHPDHVALANTLNVVPGCRDTKIADEAIARRTVVKLGSDIDHVGVCDAADVPHGITTDQSASTGEALSFGVFGTEGVEGGFEYTSSGTTAVNEMLVPADGGGLRTLPAGAGTYYIVAKCYIGNTTGLTGVATPWGPQKIVVP